MDLPGADKEQGAAFVVCRRAQCTRMDSLTEQYAQRDERVLVVWSDSLNTIIPLTKDFDEKLIQLVWSIRVSANGIPTAGSVTPAEVASPVLGTPITSMSDVHLREPTSAELLSPMPATKEVVPVEPPKTKTKSKGSLWGWRIRDKADQAQGDVESASGVSPRPVRLFAPLYDGVGAGLCVCKCPLQRSTSSS